MHSDMNRHDSPGRIQTPPHSNLHWNYQSIPHPHSLMRIHACVALLQHILLHSSFGQNLTEEFDPQCKLKMGPDGTTNVNLGETRETFGLDIW